MAGYIALLGIFCIPLFQVECSEYDTVLIDTPRKYARLKDGFYDTSYRNAHITSAATPDVLLEPQHFSNSTFENLTFTTFADGPYYNTIELIPKLRQAEAFFRRGESFLNGMPTDYTTYNIHCRDLAWSTERNVDSILTWTLATQLSIYDEGRIAVSMTERGRGLRALTQLRELNLMVNASQYRDVSTAVFIAHLPALHELNFYVGKMSSDDVDIFTSRNPGAADWRITNNYEWVRYEKLE